MVGIKFPDRINMGISIGKHDLIAGLRRIVDGIQKNIILVDIISRGPEIIDLIPKQSREIIVSLCAEGTVSWTAAVVST
jgi:hypothetical protein